MKDCDGAGCTKVHYHITPHFWDANVDQLGIEMMPTWNGDDYTPAAFNDGPIPCVDWCDDGKVPEWPGPCTTQPPSTGSSTVGPTPTGSPAPTTDDCDAKCYERFFACMDECAGDSICSSDCSRLHFECVTNCHDPDYVPTTTTTSTTTTTQDPNTTQSPEQCDAKCYETFFACMDGCAGDSICSSDCSQTHFECVQNCHDPDYNPTPEPTTQEPTTTKSTTTTTKNPILICDNNCYEDHDRCVKNCRRHDEECIEMCHIENTQCLAKCHDPDYVPPTTIPTTATTATPTTTTKPTTTTTRTTTTRTTTTSTTTTTTEFDVAACDDHCYDEYFKCLAACNYSISDLPDIDQMDACSTDCNNQNFECMIACHEN